MANAKEKMETLLIYLDDCQQITCEYPESVFDEVMKEIYKAMETGAILCLDGTYDFSMIDKAGNYLMGLNGKKIVGYNF